VSCPDSPSCPSTSPPTWLAPAVVGAALSGEHGWWGIAIAIGGALLYRIVVWTLSELRKP
jgi:hypothetical protein